MAVFKDKIELFYKGKSDDVRLSDPAAAFISSGFDIYTHPRRLTPYRSFEADENTAFNIVLHNYVSGILWALGLKTSTSHPKIYYSSGGPIGGVWTAVASGEATAGGDSRKSFLNFHGYLYGHSLDRAIWAFGDVGGVSPSFNDNVEPITGVSNCQGLITSDDLLLMPYDNKIAKKDGPGSGPSDGWTDAALILPADRVITDLIELDSNTVAVATRPKLPFGKSIVYLWDKVNVDPADAIDFGDGDLNILDLIEGALTGVMQTTSNSALNYKLYVKQWISGKTASTLLEIPSEAPGGAGSLILLHGNHTKIRDNNRIYFGLKIVLDGITYYQMAVIGRKTRAYPLAFSLAQKVDNDTAITAIDGASKVGDFFFVAHNANGSVNRNDESPGFVNTAVFISQKINGERQNPDFARQWKTLKMAGVILNSLAGVGDAATTSLYVRKDGESTWTLVRTYEDTDMGFEAGKTADGKDFGKCIEFQFKLEVKGNGNDSLGEVIAIPFAYEVNGGKLLGLK